MDRSLWPRITSGVVLAVIATAAVVAGGAAFTTLVVVAVALMAWEWDRLCGGSGWGLVPAVHAGVAVTMVLLLTGDSPGLAGAAVAVGVVVTALAAAATSRKSLWAAAGFLYTAVPAAAAIWLRFETELGAVVVLWLFAVIWSTDTGAYFTGKAVGGPKLAPIISPGKTWSGAAGGVAAASAAGGLVAWWAGVEPVWMLLLAGAVVSVAGQGGDLAISRIKRYFRIKDTSGLIPGHGGVLDRLDSTLSSLPLLAVAVYAVQEWGIAWP